MTRALDLEAREIEWLWAGRVPLGMMTLFAGDPKLGKSYVTLAMAAALSRGRALPGGEVPNRPASTILMSAEDDPARVIVPRLKAAGADLAKVHILESIVLASGHEMFPSLRADIDAITAAATELQDCRLIVIDPVSAYLRGVDENRNAALRGVLTPLKGLAEQLGAAVVLVSHLTKKGSGNGKHRVVGSVAYVGACRANHLFASDPQDPARGRVLMFDNGGNVAPLPRRWHIRSRIAAAVPKSYGKRKPYPSPSSKHCNRYARLARTRSSRPSDATARPGCAKCFPPGPFSALRS